MASIQDIRITADVYSLVDLWCRNKACRFCMINSKTVGAQIGCFLKNIVIDDDGKCAMFEKCKENDEQKQRNLNE